LNFILEKFLFLKSKGNLVAHFNNIDILKNIKSFENFVSNIKKDIR